MIKKIIAWWLSVAGKHPWFTYDKWAHAWLHTIIVRRLRSWGVDWMIAVCVSFLFGIIYEAIIDHDDDSLRDICWNLLGAVIGVLI